MSPTVTILDELVSIHREIVFPACFETIKWCMVTSFECLIERKNDKLSLKSTTFWVLPHRNPLGMKRVEFDEEYGLQFGKFLSGDKLTAATGTSGNLTVLLGYSPTQDIVDDVIAKHPQQKALTEVAPVDALQVTPRGIRAANRRRR